MIFKNFTKLEHPGFILFEGLDFSGKTTVANTVRRILLEQFKLQTDYVYNKGFLDDNIVKPEHIKRLSPEEKVRYIIECYKKDHLPNDFSEILKDRYLPTLLFYALVRTGLNLEIHNIIKPKFTLIFECSYETKLKRSKQRPELNSLETETLESEETNTQFTQTYRRIVKSLGYPFQIIDTSDTQVEDAARLCIETLIPTMVYDVEVETLVTHFEPQTFPSTVKRRLEKLVKGMKLKPITITRIVDSKGKYVESVKDGRHRARAALEYSAETIPAFVEYQYVQDLNNLKLTPVKDWRAK